MSPNPKPNITMGTPENEETIFYYLEQHGACTFPLLVTPGSKYMCPVCMIAFEFSLDKPIDGDTLPLKLLKDRYYVSIDFDIDTLRDKASGAAIEAFVLAVRAENPPDFNQYKLN